MPIIAVIFNQEKYVSDILGGGPICHELESPPIDLVPVSSEQAHRSSLRGLAEVPSSMEATFIPDVR